MDDRYIRLNLPDALTQKWNDGRVKHRSDPLDHEFLGDPLLELYSELLDSIHYVHQARLDHKISLETQSRWIEQFTDRAEEVKRIWLRQNPAV